VPPRPALVVHHVAFLGVVEGLAGVVVLLAHDAEAQAVVAVLGDVGRAGFDRRAPTSVARRRDFSATPPSPTRGTASIEVPERTSMARSISGATSMPPADAVRRGGEPVGDNALTASWTLKSSRKPNSNVHIWNVNCRNPLLT
jgi:hypothetical protein